MAGNVEVSYLDALLEIGCEEMPSAPLMNAQKQLKTLIEEGLKACGLAYAHVETLSTPRRLSALIYDCATTTEEIHEMNRGPATSIAFDEAGNPTQAAIGFARKFGLEPTELMVKTDADGKEYVFAEKSVAAQDGRELLSQLFRNTIASLEWPNYRSQRWGSEHEGFVRPIRWICALFGSEVVPVHYADVESENLTYGHRVLAPGAHTVDEPACYKEVLKSASVLGEIERAGVIRQGIADIEQARRGAHVDTPSRIFDEVVNLCEWPSVLVGSFDEEFLEVPHEIICESMLTHQRYFPIYDVAGELTREFVIVSNASEDVAATVIAGNERVVRARLDDAKFFFEEDLKVDLEIFVERTNDVVFQDKLGSVHDKTGRMETLAQLLSRQIGATVPESAQALRAAHLAKADLVSQAVVEFTNQQGVMGSYYATAHGEDPEVAQAIREHYRPRFAKDEIPSTQTGKICSVADKLDTVCGIFVAGEPPTGSSDPYAVRRNALGVLAILKTLPTTDLGSLIDYSLDAYEAQGLSFDKAQIKTDLVEFFSARLAGMAKDEGISADTIQAVSAVGVINPVDYLARVHALEDARSASPDLFDDLATAYARAAHLADPSLGLRLGSSLTEGAEQELFDACEQQREEVGRAVANHDFEGACASLARLRAPIDRFFADVMVMDEDNETRQRRLILLNRFVDVFRDVADIGALARKR